MGDKRGRSAGGECGCCALTRGRKGGGGGGATPPPAAPLKRARLPEARPLRLPARFAC